MKYFKTFSYGINILAIMEQNESSASVIWLLPVSLTCFSFINLLIVSSENHANIWNNFNYKQTVLFVLRSYFNDI